METLSYITIALWVPSFLIYFLFSFIKDNYISKISAQLKEEYKEIYSELVSEITFLGKKFTHINIVKFAKSSKVNAINDKELLLKLGNAIQINNVHKYSFYISTILFLVVIFVSQ